VVHSLALDLDELEATLGRSGINSSMNSGWAACHALMRAQ
jgi:hypothetical protein